MISKSSSVRYIQEPFNVGIKKYKSPIHQWYYHVDPHKRDEGLKAYLNSFINLFHKKNLRRLYEVRSWHELNASIKDPKSRFTKGTFNKDPIALLSAEWLYNNFDCDVIVLIRHPAAFITSLKVKGWEFDFNNLLTQEDLMNVYLKDYIPSIQEFANNKKDIISQGILLWNILYQVVHEYQSKYFDQWYFIRMKIYP